MLSMISGLIFVKGLGGISISRERGGGALGPGPRNEVSRPCQSAKLQQQAYKMRVRPESLAALGDRSPNSVEFARVSRGRER